jgi:hypothetical protein
VLISVSRLPPIPGSTAYIAKTVFGRENRYQIIGDQAERLLAGIDLAPLDPIGNQTAWPLTMCALVTILQYLENLPDQQAEAATRVRPDWKYALHLPAAYPGFDHRRLCEFRRHLRQQPAARLTLQHILDRLSEMIAGQPDPTADDVLSAVCALSCLERLIEAVHLVLEAVAVSSPEWLRANARPHWYERYNRLQLTHLLPRAREEQTRLARAIDADAVYLLNALAVDGPTVLSEVQMLWLEWERQFRQSAQQIEWLGPVCAACDRVHGGAPPAARPRFAS